jgi:hypothetical protein
MAGFPQKNRAFHRAAGLQLRRWIDKLIELQQSGNDTVSVSLAIEGGMCYS